MIHQTAVVHKGAEIAGSAEIGPFCIVEDRVKIGEGTRLLSHVVVQSGTEIGRNCVISPYASLGGPPQDITYKGEETVAIIGDNNVIREYVTINRGTAHGKGITKVGNNNFIMAYVHVAHDCTVGNSVIMANCATLAGHVEVADHVIFGGLCAVHQFCRIGSYAFVSGLTGVPKDIPPFIIAAGNRAKPYGLNIVGLERHNFSKDDISTLKKAYRLLFRSALPLSTALKIIEEELEGPHVKGLIEFIQSAKRGICR